MKTLVSWNPTHDLRSVDEALERLFGNSRPTTGSVLPVDVYEQDGKFIVKASAPGIPAEELSIQIENNVLSIKGEHKQDETTDDTKVYRREVAYGSFTRSVRLPQNLNLEAVDAEFKNGIVTISIPKVEEPKPQAIKVNVRS